MMEEEKKAIERCKQLIKPEHACWIGISNQLAINTVLNLIEKQQAEIVDEIDIQSIKEIDLFDNDQPIPLDTVIKCYSTNFLQINEKFNEILEAVKQLDNKIKE